MVDRDVDAFLKDLQAQDAASAVVSLTHRPS
jgi:hypothetical protein